MKDRVMDFIGSGVVTNHERLTISPSFFVRRRHHSPLTSLFSLVVTMIFLSHAAD